jgi:hypothetical protein
MLIIGNLLADLLLKLVDPRITLESLDWALSGDKILQTRNLHHAH